MKIYVHKETRTIARESGHRRGNSEEIEVDKDYSEELYLVFDRFEVHRASTTVWFCEQDPDGYKATSRELPMRINEFERLLKEGHDMLALQGTFGLSKQGSAVGLVRKNELRTDT